MNAVISAPSLIPDFSRHSCFVSSFLRRQESIPVFASGVTGKKMDPRVCEDDAKKIYQLHSVPSTASRLTGR
jgi:isopentenyl diphosphate isomerase/L-lactate dehydrogenase-like FMN-dependent dehydrogenase